MSGRTTPECESPFEYHDNDSQSDNSICLDDMMLTGEGNETDNDSLTVLAWYGSEASRSSFVDVRDDYNSFLSPRVSESEVDFFRGIGTFAPQNPSRNPQELSLADEPVNASIQNYPRESGTSLRHRVMAILQC